MAASALASLTAIGASSGTSNCRVSTRPRVSRLRSLKATVGAGAWRDGVNNDEVRVCKRIVYEYW